MALVTGKESVMRAFDVLGIEGREQVENALIRNGDLMVERAKTLAPKRDPKKGKRSKASIDYGPLHSEIQAELVTLPGEKGSKGALAVRVSTGRAFYGRFQEFGKANMAAQDFFWPAYRSISKRIKRSVRRALRMAVRKAQGGG